MDRPGFAAESTRTLAHIDELLGRLDLEGVDVDLASDVLTIAFDEGTDFVIHAHSAARQIWMAAGAQAWHFDLELTGGAPRWIAAKNGDELLPTLARELGRRLQRTIAW